MIKLAVVLLIGLSAGQAAAQTASREAMDVCTSTAKRAASMAMLARKARSKPTNYLNAQPGDWLRGVVDHVLHSAEKAPTMNERELTVIGYTYCIQRRPEGT